MPGVSNRHSKTVGKQTLFPALRGTRGSLPFLLLLFSLFPSPSGTSSLIDDGEQSRGVLPSCCTWDTVATFLKASAGEGQRTMAETLYVLSIQDAVKVTAGAISEQKRYLDQIKRVRGKRGGFMEVERRLQGAHADLTAEMKALAADSLPGKDELLRNMKNALGAIQRDLAVHRTIVSRKAAPSAALGELRHLDALLVRISMDCKAFLAGGG